MNSVEHFTTTKTEKLFLFIKKDIHMVAPLPLADRTTGHIWFDGCFLPWQDAKTHVLTHSLHYPSSLFEGIRILNGTVFRLPMHMRRLAESVDSLRCSFMLYEPKYGDVGESRITKIVGNYKETLEASQSSMREEQIEKFDRVTQELMGRGLSAEEIARKVVIENNIDLLIDATQQVVVRTNINTGYIRPIVYYGGESVDFARSENRIHVAIAAWDLPYFYVVNAERPGVRLVILPQYRKAPPECGPYWTKSSGNYYINSILKDIALKAGYHDALMLDWRGNVTEATGANIFFVGKDDKLYTPTPDCFFNGFTRQEIIKIAAELNIECVQTPMNWETVKTMKEGFLTGTAAGVVPIQQINYADTDDGSKVKDSHEFIMGLTAKRFISAYQKHIDKNTLA